MPREGKDLNPELLDHRRFQFPEFPEGSCRAVVGKQRMGFPHFLPCFHTAQIHVYLFSVLWSFTWEKVPLLKCEK